MAVPTPLSNAKRWCVHFTLFLTIICPDTTYFSGCAGSPHLASGCSGSAGVPAPGLQPSPTLAADANQLFKTQNKWDTWHDELDPDVSDLANKSDQAVRQAVSTSVFNIPFIFPDMFRRL